MLRAAMLYAADAKVSSAGWSLGHEHETAGSSSHHGSINCGFICGPAGGLTETPDELLVGVDPARRVSS